MVLLPAADGAGPVELLQGHHPRQFVRKGKGSEAPALVHPVHDGGIEAGGAADHHRHRAGEALPAAQPVRQLLAAPRLSGPVQGHHYYFGVRFIDRKVNPFYSYTWISLGLLFLTLLFFAYSLWVILKQRTLAEMQKDFINNLTHEFKTPIAAVSISSDVLLQNEIINANPRLKQYAQIIKNQNQLLNSQVERVLQVARMEKTDFHINPEPIDTHEIIMDIVSSAEPRAKSKGGEILTNLSAMAPVISADRIHFIHVIQNILDNAIKYSPENNIKVEISTYDHNNHMVIKCTDHGPGIPEKYQKKIFSRFYRVPTGNVHNVKGFGLGLNYVYQICKAHRWKIRVESKVGIGTSLYIEIPK